FRGIVEDNAHPAVAMKDPIYFEERMAEQDPIFVYTFILDRINNYLIGNNCILLEPTLPKKVHFRVVDISTEWRIDGVSLGL
ncbi:MAG: hypothetical protein DCC55_39950, partial [Chloroflexi bacterium]